MAIETQFPSWMIPRESPIDSLIKGVQAGSMIAHNMQQGQSLALQAQNQEQQIQLAQKKFALDAESQGLHNQVIAQGLDETRADLPLWQQFNQDLNSAAAGGSDAVATLAIPPNFSPKSIATAIHLKTSVLGQIAQTSEAKQYGDVMSDYAKLDTAGKAQVNEAGGIPSKFQDITPEILNVMQVEKDRMDADKLKEAIALRSAPAAIAAQSRENVALIRSQESEKAKTSGDATPVYMEDGTIVPGQVKFWTGRTWQYRNAHNPNDLKAMTISQRQSALRTLISSNQKAAEDARLADDAQGAEAYKNKVEGYRKELDDMLRGHTAKPTTGTNAPAGTVKKWNPDTNDFE